MEPISAASGLLSVIAACAETQDKVSNLARSSTRDREAEAVLLEASVFNEILSDLGSRFSFAQGVPQTIHGCLRLCTLHNERFKEALTKFEKSRKVDKDLLDALKGFRRSVKLLRNVITDSTTHHLLGDLRQQAPDQRKTTRDSHLFEDVSEEMVDKVTRWLQDYSMDASVDAMVIRQPSEEDVGALRDSLKATLHTHQGDEQPDTTTPFSFSVRILGSHESNHVRSIGHLDTKCKDNWVSADIINRAGLEHEIRETDKGPFAGFSGQHFHPVGQVELTWYAEAAGRSRETTFLVCQDAPFDLILGSDFIITEGLLYFDQPALALRPVDLSPTDQKQMGANMLQRGADSAEMHVIRDASDSAKRESRRMAKKLKTWNTGPPSSRIFSPSMLSSHQSARGIPGSAGLSSRSSVEHLALSPGDGKSGNAATSKVSTASMQSTGVSAVPAVSNARTSTTPLPRGSDGSADSDSA